MIALGVCVICLSCFTADVDTLGSVRAQPPALAVATPAAPPTLSAHDLDAWARFPVGSWRVVRTVTQTYDPFGKVTQNTVSETQTTLSRADTRQMCLKIDVTTQVNGRRIQGTPHEVERGFWGETAQQPVEEKTAVPSKISIEGREVPCLVHEASYGDEQLKTVTKRYVSTDLAPFVLKSETQTTAPNTTQPRYRTVSEVFALDMPCKVGSEIKLGSHERLVRQTPQETMISLDTNVPDIPGGVVARTTKELDEFGATAAPQYDGADFLPYRHGKRAAARAASPSFVSSRHCSTR
ncbi:MAG: hypothetical protein QM811_29100 [Pirellulales bacterium]